MAHNWINFGASLVSAEAMEYNDANNACYASSAMDMKNKVVYWIHGMLLLYIEQLANEVMQLKTAGFGERDS